MKIAVFSSKPYDRQFLAAANEAAGSNHEIRFIESHLELSTAALAMDAEAVCPFVNDQVDEAVLTALASQGVRLIAPARANARRADRSR